MKSIATQVTGWVRAVNAARKTSGKKFIDRDPSDIWKAKALLAEHSPIRLVEYDIDIEAIRQWVTVHLVRHHIGVEKFVHSQREDRRDLGGIPRDELPQGAENDMMYSCNAQALINISRKRCCKGCPSKETQEAWNMVKESIRKVDPIMADAMVKECVYRGFCPEFQPCGYCFTEEYRKELEAYRSKSKWAEMKSKIESNAEQV